MDFSLPTLTTGYVEFLAQMKERDEDIIKMLDGITSSNLPSGAKRWNSDGSKWEKYNGTEWSNLATLYEIKVRDSDKLNGQTANYYAIANHGHSNATTTTSGFMSSTDKSKLDGVAENANNYSHPTSDGNLHVPSNGTANNGKFLQATGVAGTYVWATLPSASLSTLGISATADELSILDGVTVTAAKINYLNNVTSDIQSQINSKQNTLISGNSIKTINGISVLGSGDIPFIPVNTSIAGLSAYAIGTYTFGGSSSAITAGSIVSGSTINNTAGGTVGVGTWRAMNSTSSSARNAIYLRIA